MVERESNGSCLFTQARSCVACHACTAGCLKGVASVPNSRLAVSARVFRVARRSRTARFPVGAAAARASAHAHLVIGVAVQPAAARFPVGAAASVVHARAHLVIGVAVQPTAARFSIGTADSVRSTGGA